MQISLIIPAYNEERWIGKTLDSVQKNAPGRFKEIIVVDNASTDGTADVARSHPGVRVVREERKGTNYARECGYRMATGDVIALLDADTLMRPGWVDKVVNAFERDPDLACITGPYWFYDLPLWEAVLLWLNWHFAIIGHFFTQAMGVTGNMAIRRSVLEQMGGFDTSLTFDGDDVDTALRASRYGRVRFTFSVILDSSGRRYRKFGTLRTIGFYIRNTLRVVFGMRPNDGSATAEAR